MAFSWNERFEMKCSFLGVRFRFVLVVASVAVMLVACSDGEGGEAGSDLAVVEPTATLTPTVNEPTATNVPPTTVPDPTVAIVVTPTAKPDPTATPVPTATPEEIETFDRSRFTDVEGIVDPTNFGWPRSVETSEGVITVDEAPRKIHSLSLGHSEILAGLVDFDRITAVYSFFADPEQSNISDLSTDALMIGFDPEEVVALEPDVIVASRFTNADTVALMKDAGIPVVRASLENSALGNVPNILLIGYLVGAEKEAIALADEIESRMNFITDVLGSTEGPRVLSVSKWTSAFAAGSGSTEGGIIEQAGGVNAAADSGIEGHQQVSIESIAAMNPDVIIVPQPLDGATAFIEELQSSPALVEVPAVKNREIHYVSPRLHTTLSHWNVRGVEELAELLFPSAFEGVEFEEFAHWSE